MIQYTDPALVGMIHVGEAPRYGVNADGYGKKAPTSYRIRYLGRLRRVYAACLGNGASMYIVVNGEDVFLDGETQVRLCT